MESKTDKQSGAGEFRCLSPEEISFAVRSRRELLGMKQLTLAQIAGITERTVQRIEGGQKADGQTLMAVAGALGFASHAFIGPRMIRTPEEAIAKVSNFFERWQFVEAPLVTDWRDIQSLMLAHALVIDDSELDGDTAERVTELRDSLEGSLDFADLLSARDRMEYAKATFDILRPLQEAGIVARFAVAEMKNGMKAGALILLSKGHNRAKVTQALFPTDFTDLMRSGPSPEAMWIADWLIDAKQHKDAT